MIIYPGQHLIPCSNHNESKKKSNTEMCYMQVFEPVQLFWFFCTNPNTALCFCYLSTYFDTSILSSISRFSRSMICRLSASLTALLTLFDSSSLNSCSTFCASRLILVSLKKEAKKKRTIL